MYIPVYEEDLDGGANDENNNDDDDSDNYMDGNCHNCNGQ